MLLSHLFLDSYISVCIFPPSGQLVDFIKRVEQKAPLSCDTVLKILYQTCRAVQHMHKQKPPIIHRDLKVCHCLLLNETAYIMCNCHHFFIWKMSKAFCVIWRGYCNWIHIWYCNTLEAILITNWYFDVYWLTWKSTAFFDADWESLD